MSAGSVLVRKDWLKIGIVGRARGLSGEFFVSGRDDAVPIDYETLVIGADPVAGRSAQIIASRCYNGKPALRCSLAADRTAAEALGGQLLWVKREQVAVDEVCEYLWDEIVGRNVFGPDGALIGKVEAIYNAGASDIVTIADESGRYVDLAFVEDWFDLSFERGGDDLRLRVPVATFAEFWEKTPPNRGPRR